MSAKVDPEKRKKKSEESQKMKVNHFLGKYNFDFLRVSYFPR